jgi:Lysyl oxidase/Chitobiase/beta-hexosaminidase C-terminal domain/Bacterial pre-peptidase C-terminal domain
MSDLSCRSVRFLLHFLFLLGAFAFSSQAQTVLTNGVSVTNLSGAAGSAAHYKISVPAGRATLDIRITGSGDCDLYVRFGAQPTTSTYDYRPYKSSSNETVTVTNPRGGDWFIMLRGYKAYSGLTLVATYPGATVPPAATPAFSPAPGTYPQQQNVTLSTATADAIIRYTTNGADPTASSTVYSAPLILGSTTTIKARAFKSGLADSAVATGTYTILGSGITELQNGNPKAGLSGAKNSQTHYRISVPAGQSSLVVTIQGSGDCDLYVRRGAQPTLSLYDYRPYQSNSNETVTVSNPASGDWYIMLHGYSAYSSVTLRATYSANAMPDLIPVLSSLNASTSTETFSGGSCDVSEGLVTSGTRRLLRFTTETRNIGTADLVLRSPAGNPLFTYAPCHGHYHFNGFAEYRLLNSAGQQVALGQKVGFCLEDVSRWNPNANSRAVYDCDYQGIQAGWSDIYSKNLPGQWIDITGVAPGTYVLEIRLDTLNRISEADETNNVGRAEVTFSSTNGSVTSRPLP